MKRSIFERIFVGRTSHLAIFGPKESFINNVKHGDDFGCFLKFRISFKHGVNEIHHNSFILFIGFYHISILNKK